MVNQHTVKRPYYNCECGDHSWVVLTRGYCALFSPEDADFLAQWSWSVLVLPDGKLRATRRRNVDQKMFYMHREILEPAPDGVVDHINADGIDNRRSNLRACSQAENVRWQRPQRRLTSSRFKGVSFDKNRSRWQAYINVDGKRTNIGRFADEETAAEAYDRFAEKQHGEFALTNRKLGLLP